MRRVTTLGNSRSQFRRCALSILILGAVGMIVDQNQQIAVAVEQQTAVAHDIDQNIAELNRAGEHAAQGAYQTEAASRQLSMRVIELKPLIGAFRV